MSYLNFKILIAFITIFNFTSIGQNKNIFNDTINRLDGLGKKDGYWVQYLNKGLRRVKKAEKASFYRYIKYVHGICLDYEIIQKLYIRKTTTDPNNTLSKTVDLILLNGTYKLYEIHKRFLFRDGVFKKEYNLLKECVFNNGTLLELTGYSDDSIHVTYFEKKYDKNELSFLVKDFKDGNMISSFYSIFENNNWKIIKI